MPNEPVIPAAITVHLGRPDQPAENVTVSFPEYIKNVASSEIYPTWPESAIIANIYAQISYALNRIYTEWYPSQGYDFDITNTTAFDQSFVNGRNVFENISMIVDEIFNRYVRRRGNIKGVVHFDTDSLYGAWRKNNLSDSRSGNILPEAVPNDGKASGIRLG